MDLTGKRLFALAAAITVVSLTAPELHAQNPLGLTPAKPAKESQPDPLTLEQIKARIAGLTARSGRISAQLNAALEPAERTHFGRLQDGIDGVQALLQQQETALLAGQGQPPSDHVEEGSTTLEDRSAFALNELLERTWQAKRSNERKTTELETARQALDQAKEVLAKAERERREAKGQLESAGMQASRDQQQAYDLLEIKSLEARERLNLRTLRVRQRKAELESGNGEAPGLEERIAAMRKAIAGDGATQGAHDASLAAAEGQARRRREALERELSTAELRLNAVQARYSKQNEPPAQLIKEVEVLTFDRDAIRQRIVMIDAELIRLKTADDTYTKWQTAIAGEVSRELLHQWRTAASENLDELDQADVRKKGRIADLRDRLDAVTAQMNQLDVEPATRRLLEQQRTALQNQLQAHTDDARSLANHRRLTERYLAELRDLTGIFDPVEYVVGAIGAARDVWRYELTSIDDEPITIGSLCLAILLGAAGIFFSRRISGVVGATAEHRFSLDRGASAALQTIAFYALFVGFTLLALRMVNFPLTAFTVLGGALAIGVGFGSQNVMNNFISGLLLMLERPIRVRDLVEIDGTHGVVEHIGARSTQIRSTDGRQMIVPNSFFLENNVVNWTLSDDLLRGKLTVGVVYGAPTLVVEKLLQQIVAEEPGVLKRPEPVVIFEDFGNDALTFDTYVWVHARSPMEMRRVMSRLRFRVDELFRENGIVIAFPQRDVHLDSLSPIEVRLTRDE